MDKSQLERDLSELIEVNLRREILTAIRFQFDM